MTQILEDVRVFKACSLSQLKRHLRKMEIEPLGLRQKPQNYPDDSSKRILAALGFPQDGGPKPLPATTTLNKFQSSVLKLAKTFPPANGTNGKHATAVVSLKKLQSVRAKGKGSK